MCESHLASNLPKLPWYPDVAHKSKFGKIQWFPHKQETQLPESPDIDPVLLLPQRTQQPKVCSVPPFKPHYVREDRRCLRFFGYFMQQAFHTALESTRVRSVHLLYFLEDDTITVIEPTQKNSGLVQGRLVRRSRVPVGSPPDCDYLHWKDLNIGVVVQVCGFRIRLIDCDPFTREFMISQGVLVSPPESLPEDQYTLMMQTACQIPKQPPQRRAGNDNAILRFRAIDEAKKEEYGVSYFTEDNTMLVTRVARPNSGCDPFRVFLKRSQLAKNVPNLPVAFPDKPKIELYMPEDLLVGEMLNVNGKLMRFLSCDAATRSYFESKLRITQPADICLSKAPPPPRPKRPIQTLEIKEPRKDVVRQIVHANHFLRYKAVLDSQHPEDDGREFVLSYSLADGRVSIMEPPQRNSGHLGGKFLAPMLLPKPDSDILYYTPNDFAIGAVVEINGFRFIVTGTELHVYNYMKENPEKFRPEVIETVRNHLLSNGTIQS